MQSGISLPHLMEKMHVVLVEKKCKPSKTTEEENLTPKQLNQYAGLEIIGIKSSHVSHREVEKIEACWMHVFPKRKTAPGSHFFHCITPCGNELLVSTLSDEIISRPFSLQCEKINFVTVENAPVGNYESCINETY